MSERPKEHDWKSCIDVSLSRVRLPLSPPVKSKMVIFRQNINGIYIYKNKKMTGGD